MQYTIQANFRVLVQLEVTPMLTLPVLMIHQPLGSYALQRQKAVTVKSVKKLFFLQSQMPRKSVILLPWSVFILYLVLA